MGRGKEGRRVKGKEREGRKEEWGRKSRDGVRKKRDILSQVEQGGGLQEKVRYRDRP